MFWDSTESFNFGGAIYVLIVNDCAQIAKYLPTEKCFFQLTPSQELSNGNYIKLV